MENKIMWPRIKWVDTSIEHHGNNTNNKKCVIVIPVYKQEPNMFEKESLKQVVKVLGDKYELVLVLPTALDVNIYNKIGNYEFSILRCNGDFFKSQRSYSDLCEMWQFYNAFSEYEFMVIYQLDAWIFEDKINYFIEKNYDYIGAPHLVGFGGRKEGENGNGGFCLRRIKPFLEVCKKTDFSRFGNFEDCAFTQQLKSNFKLAPIELCREFSFQELPHIMYQKNNNRLPMGCHAFRKNNERFWRQYISAYNNKEYKEEKDAINKGLLELMYGQIDGIDTGAYRLKKFEAIKRRVIKKH